MRHFATKSFAGRALRLVGALACVAVLGGCGGVEFEGKIFDYMGVSGSGQPEGDLRMSERPPLLVPPSVKTLPQPGTNAAVTAARQDWPDDPELVRKRIAKQEKAKEIEVLAVTDPINPYAGKPNLLDKLFGGSDTELVPVAAVPEPDASDRAPSETAVAQRPTSLTPHVPQAPLPENDAGKPATPESYGRVSNPTGGNQAGW